MGLAETAGKEDPVELDNLQLLNQLGSIGSIFKNYQKPQPNNLILTRPFYFVYAVSWPDIWVGDLEFNSQVEKYFNFFKNYFRQLPISLK